MSNYGDSSDFYVFPHSKLNQGLTEGTLRPVRVKPLPCDTATFTADSHYRISGTDYNFTVSTQKAIMGPLKAQVTRVTMPKIPNINAMIM